MGLFTDGWQDGERRTERTLYVNGALIHNLGISQRSTFTYHVSHLRRIFFIAFLISSVIRSANFFQPSTHRPLNIQSCFLPCTASVVTMSLSSSSESERSYSPPTKKRRKKNSKTNVKTKTVTTRDTDKEHEKEVENEDKSVLIVLENHLESMDVTLTAQVFEKLGVSVSYVACFQNRPLHLSGGVTMKADTSFVSALKVPWSLLVLPGGNEAMPLLLAQKSFVTFVTNHLEKRNGLVAAMGSSATQILPYLGFVDKLGPICYPLLGTQVVLQQGNVWAAPGKGTATELALAFAEHWFGRNAAQQVANSLGYVQAPWHIDNLKDRTFPEWASDDRIKIIDAAFWDIVWPKLCALGWGSNFETRNAWTFWRCGFDDCLVNKTRIKGKDWFESSRELLECLNEEMDASYVHIMRQFHEKIALAKASELQPVQESDNSQELFKHVVWTRLESLGWTKLESDVYCTPAKHEPRAELASPDCVLRYLLIEPLFCTNPQYLSIVDLYRNCKLTSKTLQTGKTPSEIEAITKEGVPSLATY